MRKTVHSPLVSWVILTACLVLGMVVLGGFTRLTGSGLSMVDWKPITGILPPMTLDDWQRVFALYKTSPEYHQVNAGMTLEGFKGIFWLEYIHRLLGRIIGLVFLVPLVMSLATKELRKWFPRLACLWMLGGLQGILGWYMVQSGLIKTPWVSPYRLTAHLVLALVTYGGLIWTIFQMRSTRFAPPFSRGLKNPWLTSLLCLLGGTISYGGLVAGMKAGLIYNTFPWMEGRLIPHEAFFYTPWFKNFFTNPATIQMTHRFLALGTLMVALGYIYKRFKEGPRLTERRGLVFLGYSVLGQVVLGIATLVLQVPLVLAAMHQAGAFILVTSVLGLMYEQGHQFQATEDLQYIPKKPLRPSTHS